MIARQKPPIRALFKWYGGKWFLKSQLIDMMPPHKRYVEAFAGGACILLNKVQTECDTLNENNEIIVHLYKLVRDNPRKVIDYLKDIEYCLGDFTRAYNLLLDPETDMDTRALSFLITTRMSYAGQRRCFVWTDSFCSGQPQEYTVWDNFKANRLQCVVDRLQGVEITCSNAIYQIPKWDSPETLIYCDPPYMLQTRKTGSRNKYTHEMSFMEHNRLAQNLNACKGYVILSGYDSPFYKEWFKDWFVRSWSMKNSAIRGNRVSSGEAALKREIVWCNFNPTNWKHI